MRQAACMIGLLGAILVSGAAASAGTGIKINISDSATRPAISGNLVVYYGCNGSSYDYVLRRYVCPDKGIYVYDRKTRQTKKIAVPVLADLNNPDVQPMIAGDFIVWHDIRSWTDSLNGSGPDDNWDVFGCKYDRQTGACPVYQLTTAPFTQGGPMVDEQGFVLWIDYRNNWSVTHGLGNTDIYGCQFDPATGACPERQLTTWPYNDMSWVPMLKDWHFAWSTWNNPDGSTHGYTCVYDPQTGQCANPVTEINKTGGTTLAPTPYDLYLACNFSSTIALFNFAQPAAGFRPIASGIDPAVDGNQVVYGAYGNVYVYDAATGQTSLAVSTGHIVQRPAISQGCVAYYGYGLDQYGWPRWGAYLVKELCAVANHPPTVDPVSAQTVQEDQPVRVTITATDPDGDALVYSAGTLPPGASFDPAAHVLSWTPTFEQAGAYSVPVTVTDPDGLSATGTVSITVLNTNRPPVLQPVGNRLLQYRQPFSLTLACSDPDKDVLRFGAANALPAGATLDSSSGVFQWTPAPEQAGTYTIWFTCSDEALTAMETGTFDVPQNHPPVLAPIGPRQTDEGQQLTFTVSASDADGDPLTYSATNLPAGATFDPASRTFTWTPTYNQAGTYTVAFHVADSEGLADTELVVISVANLNRPPAFDPIPDQTVNEDQLLALAVQASDPDGDALVYSAGTLPPGASFDPAAHVLSWTPTFEQAGAYSVPVTVTDPDGLSATGTVSITVLNTDRPPALAPIGPRQTDEGQQLTFTVSASDADGDPLTYSATNLPAGATFDPASRTFTWTPTYNQAGTYEVTFGVADPETLAAIEVVTITVLEVNRPPEFDPIPDATIPEGAVYTKTVSATDHDGDPVTYAASPILPGAAFDAMAHTFSWTPGYNQQGQYTVTFTVSDPHGGSAAKPVLFTVTNVNRAPSVTSPATYTVVAGSPLAFTLRASDPDGDALTYRAGTLPKGAKFDPATAKFTWATTKSQVGQYLVTFYVSDGTATVSQTVTISVVKSAPKR